MVTNSELILTEVLLPTENESNLMLNADGRLYYFEIPLSKKKKHGQWLKPCYAYFTSKAIKESGYALTKREDGEWLFGEITKLGHIVMFETDSSRTPLKQIEAVKIEFTNDYELTKGSVRDDDPEKKSTHTHLVTIKGKIPVFPKKQLPKFVKWYNTKKKEKYSQIICELEWYTKGFSQDHGGNIGIPDQRIKLDKNGQPSILFQ